MNSVTDPVTVAVVGSLNMDLIAYASRLPLPGETLLGTSWTTQHGGKGANQALAAVRLGAPVAMVGRIGQDSYGSRLRDALISEGVDCHAVEVDPNDPTGVALIMVDSCGQNSIMVIPGSNANLIPSDIDRHQRIISDARVIVCQLETPLPTVRRAIETARTMSKLVILNPAPAPTDGRLPEELLHGVDLLIPNQLEAELLTGQSITCVQEAHLAARALLSRGCRKVIITLGAEGAVLAERDLQRHFPAQECAVVDATGAGDTFVGAIAASLARGDRIESAIAFAQCAAAISVGRRGAQMSIPVLAEVLAQMMDSTISARH